MKNPKKNYILLLLYFYSILLFFACGNPAKQQSTTRGQSKVGVDESFRLIADAEIYAFSAQYPEAIIEPLYMSEGELLELMKKDSLRLIIIGRKLSTDEIKFFEAKRSHPKITKIAYDGLALIVNRANPDTNISFENLEKIFRGELKTWNLGQSAKKSDSIRIVFDHPLSSNVRYLKNTLNLKSLPGNCYAVKSNQEVVNYVEKNRNAIGIIGSNWISDPEDTVSHAFLSKIKVVGISSRNDPSAALGYVKPYQGYIASGEYPFKREINIISRELGVRVGTGFAAFTAGDVGQRIILKSGLVPALAPVRLINTGNE